MLFSPVQNNFYYIILKYVALQIVGMQGFLMLLLFIIILKGAQALDMHIRRKVHTLKNLQSSLDKN